MEHCRVIFGVNCSVAGWRRKGVGHCSGRLASNKTLLCHHAL